MGINWVYVFYTMLRDKQLKVYNTALFPKSYIRDIVITALLYVCIECLVSTNHHYAPHIIHSIYEYMTDSELFAFVTHGTPSQHPLQISTQGLLSLQ